VDAVRGEPHHPYCFISALVYINRHVDTRAYCAPSLVEFPRIVCTGSPVAEKNPSRKLGELRWPAPYIVARSY